MSHSLPQEMPLHLVWLLYIINSLEVEGAGVSPSEQQPTWPQLCACLVFCLFVFSGISHHPQLGFQDKLVQGTRLRLSSVFGSGQCCNGYFETLKVLTNNFKQIQKIIDDV
jgi:hypothetical protein